jgi:hypothetical protein
MVEHAYVQGNGLPANFIYDNVEDFSNLAVNVYGWAFGVDTGPSTTGDPHATATIPGFLNTMLFVMPKILVISPL